VEDAEEFLGKFVMFYPRWSAQIRGTEVASHLY